MKSRAVETGCGVERTSDPTVKEEEVSEVDIPHEDKDDWSNKPVLKDQAKKPGMWKPGKLHAACFDLSNKDQLTAYNALLARTTPPESPEIILSKDVETKFFEGKFYALVHYQDILYRIVIKK